MDIKNIYQQLTNVDIEEQRKLWDERGKGYYGEFLVFCDLYKYITGNGKLLMNLNIPVDASKTTEIDLLMIHETGIYVFEIKHYKGTIYGKDSEPTWTQYFRTVKNNTFKNPLLQNQYHIAAISKLFPTIPIQSIVVFTSDDCDLRISNSSNTDICLLDEINYTLKNKFKTMDSVLTMEDIDDVFQKLSAYSPMQECITIDTDAASFFSWIQPTIHQLEEKKKEIEQEKEKLIQDGEKLKKAKRKGVIANILVAFACIGITIMIIFGFQKQYDAAIKRNNDEVNAFKQNFLHIDEIGNEYIDALNSYVNVSNITLSSLTDHSVSFTARLSMKNNLYGIVLTEESKYIVMTDSGKVFEYDVFGEHLSYSRLSNTIGQGFRSYGDLKTIPFYGIKNTNEISYIKITNVDLLHINPKRTVIKSNLEIELYSK